ncbi:hypothetical protein F1C10_07105 [Sphingomonas sp. NBWT7]|uniref:hypothetical protein n=1 Tax=Sphingomonas sp. NBWT7 TaxID=2596913 RepID=UPI001624BDCE|nr:hypothetical protein [Sphingomonas sp. NBWT7]QNE31724.1 hypothetical protein F1C10_07105 [Sphingomonas sp. NBWT7]
MTGFDLVFAVYGLLLGLAIAEVLGGLSRALKLKRGARPVRVGWLTPLLGVLAMLDLSNFWMLAWDARDQIQANYVTLLAVLTMVGTYYLAATLIFPDEPAEWPDFDDWFDRQKGFVIGGLLAANVLSWIGLSILDSLHPLNEVAGPDNPLADLVYIGCAIGILGLFVAILVVRNRRWNAALLAALCLMMATSSVLEGFV